MALQLPFSFAYESRARFDSFRCEPANASLLHHLQQAPAPGQFTWLWGTHGAGKSHLLQACCRQWPQAIYLPLPRLLDYEPDSLDSLHDSEWLVLDDLDALAGKPQWEERLFALVNHLLASKAVLLCAAAQPTAQTAFALADLKSRLQLSVVYEVHALGDAGKAAVLVERARDRGIELKDEVVQYLMARHARNLHDLLALLDQLDHQALAEQRRLTIPFVKATLGW